MQAESYDDGPNLQNNCGGYSRNKSTRNYLSFFREFNRTIGGVLIPRHTRSLLISH